VARSFATRWARGYTDRNPTADIKPADIIQSRKQTNYARVTAKELLDLRRKMAVYDGSPHTRAALRLVAQTFVRTSELIEAKWNEFDLKAAEWRIPAERMKMRTPHVVPLARQSVDVLRCLEELRRISPYVFPGERDHERPMSNNTLLKALERMGYKGRMTGHGFRGVASTALPEHGFEHALIELQLAHQERNRVGASYNWATYLPQRRKMMQWWAGYLDAARTGRASRRWAACPGAASSTFMLTAVDKVNKGKGRVVNERFAAMCAHYLFDLDFCNVASGWEKGEVEKNVQDSRRRVWIEAGNKRFGSFVELNAWLAARCRALWEQVRHPEHEQFTIAEMLEHERRADAHARAVRRLRGEAGAGVEHLLGDGGAQPVLGAVRAGGPDGQRAPVPERSRGRGRQRRRCPASPPGGEGADRVRLAALHPLGAAQARSATQRCPVRGPAGAAADAAA
jgi:hypothetical protein